MPQLNLLSSKCMLQAQGAAAPEVSVEGQDQQKASGTYGQATDQTGFDPDSVLEDTMFEA